MPDKEAEIFADTLIVIGRRLAESESDKYNLDYLRKEVEQLNSTVKEQSIKITDLRNQVVLKDNAIKIWVEKFNLLTIKYEKLSKRKRGRDS